jgi:hypothetical protein
MPKPTPERVAVLVVRAWREGQEASGARARITWVEDVAEGTEQTALAATAAEVLEAVRRWLQNVWEPPSS